MVGLKLNAATVQQAHWACDSVTQYYGVPSNGKSQVVTCQGFEVSLV